MRPERGTTRFVIDEDTGLWAAQGIRDAGGTAILLEEERGKGAKDVDWLPTVHELGDAVITRDASMRFDHKEAFKQCRIHVFVVTAKDLRFDEIRELMRTQHAAMCRLVRRDAAPFLARVNRTGITIVYTGGRRGGIRRG